MKRSAFSFLFSMLSLVHAAPALSDQELSIGVLASLSGNWAELGTETRNGVLLAAEEINDRGGVNGHRLKLLVQDTDEAESPRTLLSAYFHLRSRGVQFFVGPNGTPGGLALSPIASREEVVVVAPAIGVEEGFCSKRRNLFNIQGGWESASRKLADKMFRSGIRRVAVFGSEHPFEKRQANVFSKEFENLGGRLSFRADLPTNESDLRGLLRRGLGEHPEGVFLSLYNTLGLAAKQLRQLQYFGPLATIQIDDSRLVGAEGGLSGVMFAKLAQASATFEADYQKRFGKMPGYPAEFAYDALFVLAQGISRAGNFQAEDVSEEISRGGFIGVSGRLFFNKCGHVQREPELYRLVGDSKEPLAE